MVIRKHGNKWQCIVRLKGVSVTQSFISKADARKWNKETWKYENSGALWEVTLNESRQQVLAVMKHFVHVKKQIEVKPSEVAAHLGETGVKAKAKIQKTMQRMVEGQHLVNGSTYGTYKLYSSLTVSENAKQYETETYN
jgi:hypothetical protein